ncbi:MAG: TonB-dependent receptor, partial [Pyrinomonadaceae bacterium]
LAFFVQDDWKFRPNLTLNLGLRWSYYSPVTASDGVLGNLLPDANGGLAGATIVTDKTLYDKDYNNFAPQLGFAWSPQMFESKLVIRGGAGLGFDRLPNALLAQARRNPPNGRNNGFCCAGPWDPFLGGRMSYVSSTDGTVFGYPANPVLAGTNANGLPLGGNLEIYGAPRDIDTAYVMRYSLEGQYELPAKMVATLGYSGAQGRHFVRILPLHVTAPTSNNLIGAAFFASSDVNSSFNALLARLQGRFAKQFSFDANYRFSKGIDTASFEGSCFCTNQSYPIDQKEERGPSDFDVRHNFTMTGIWEIPYPKHLWAPELLGGWQLSGIATHHTGFPWTPKLESDLVGPSGRGFGPIRPTSYNGTQPLSNSNDNFLQPGGLFAGSVPTTVFGTTIVGNTFAGNAPGIGRNTFRGPKYFAVDMSIAKKFQFGDSGFFGENAALDIRFNFFNIFNNLNLVPFTANSDPTRVTRNSFATATAGQAGRVGEFQMRFSF